jgi:hypothetical protein
MSVQLKILKIINNKKRKQCVFFLRRRRRRGSKQEGRRRAPSRGGRRRARPGAGVGDLRPGRGARTWPGAGRATSVRDGTSELPAGMGWARSGQGPIGRDVAAPLGPVLAPFPRCREVEDRCCTIKLHPNLRTTG